MNKPQAEFTELKYELLSLGKQHNDTAKKYYDVCVEYGKVMSMHQKYLAERIMHYKDEKKNIGMEMAILFAIADQHWEYKRAFIDLNEKLNELEYVRKGLERVLDALKSAIFAIQGLLRLESEGEKYYGK